MKNKNNKFIIILSVLLVLSIIFIIVYNFKTKNVENLQYSNNLGVNDSKLKKYDKLNTYSCYVECVKNTSPSQCKYFTTNAKPSNNNFPGTGTCKLLDEVTSIEHRSTDTLYYVSDTRLPDFKYISTPKKGYSDNVVELTTLDDVHKETCDMECMFNPLCTSYTTDITDNLYSGSCTLYNEPTQNNIVNKPRLTLYTKPIISYFR